jgi:hypothetical protein
MSECNQSLPDMSGDNRSNIYGRITELLVGYEQTTDSPLETAAILTYHGRKQSECITA